VAWPGQENPVTAAGRGHMRASHADRDRVIDTLKAAFVQGRLTKDEFDARVGRTLASRTYAELATVTAGIPAGPARAKPPPKPARRQVSNVARWGTSGLITPAILAAAFAFASMPGDRRYGAIGLVIAFVYFVFWLSAGADMLWEWYCLGSPTARICVRCAHTAASHHTPRSCAVGRGSLKLWRRCECAGYVPPGLSPKAVDQRALATRSASG
jgi:Domain of unknown function (DUF1707)